MKTKRLFLSLMICSLGPIQAFSYAYLQEYIASDNSTIRTSSFASDDKVVTPVWDDQIDFILCTKGSGFANANITFEDSKVSELKTDIQNALNAWKNAGSGTSLDVGSVTTDGSCGPDEGDEFGGADGKNQIFFNNVIPQLNNSSSILAYTLVSLSLNSGSGELRIIDTDIYFNNSDNFLTKAYIDANPETIENWPSNTLESTFSFRGVLQHEIGHAIGVAHSPITDDNSSDNKNTASTMFHSVSDLNRSIALQNLNSDDKLAVQNLYPTGNPFGGTVSGTVYQADGTPNRGAHIFAFSLDRKISLGGVFSAMNGTKSGVDGSWQIDGIPYEEEFIVMAEPADRTDVTPSFSFSVFNQLISQALQSEAEGYKDFFVEAYPDSNVVDVRLTQDISAGVGISNAEVFELSESAPVATGIDFYLSQDSAAPNDDPSIVAQSNSGGGCQIQAQSSSNFQWPLLFFAATFLLAFCRLQLLRL